MGVPHIDRDVFIDNDESVEAVLRQLVETEHVAERKGFALAIGHPHPTTIAGLAGMAADAEGKGLCPGAGQCPGAHGAFQRRLAAGRRARPTKSIS